MAGRLSALFLLIYAFIFSPLIQCITVALPPPTKQNGTAGKFLISEEERCSERLERALNSMVKRRSGQQRSASLELSGYALHQALRSVPYDMYVTDMRLRAAGPAWARVDRCRYDPGGRTLQARLLFRDLAVSGAVRLYDGVRRPPDDESERCNMTLRMRRAGLGFTVAPARTTGPNHLSTATTFVEPQFVSVHAYGCKSPEDIVRRRDGPEARSGGEAEVSEEMEQVFLRGVRSLITRYMEHQLEPALRDTLMLNLGYSLSYGR